jgi:hypothetical protein
MEQRAGARDRMSSPTEYRAARREEREQRSRGDDNAAGSSSTAVGASMWDLALTFWPVEDRPEPMKCKTTVNNMRLQDIFDLQARCEVLAQKEGKGSDSFGRDRKLPDRVYKEQKDNCADKLHEVRWD